MKFQRLLFVTLLLSLSLLFIISVEAKPRKKKSTKKHTSKKSKKVADEDNSANEASSDEKTSEDKTSEGESGEEEINSTNSADEEEHGKETLLTTDTKTQEVQKETYIIDFDFDFDNTFFFNLPMLYFRIFINSLPNYLFRALVGRLVPFLLCTGLHEVSVNFLKQRIELNLKLYVAIYCSMEIVAFFRYWNGEVFSTFAQRLFPSLLYQNGSMNFENTLFGIDIYSLFYLSVLYSIVDCIVIEPLFWNIVVAVIIFFISSNCLLNGLPGIRHLNYLVFVGIAGGSGYGYFTLTKPSTSLIMTSLSCILLLVASLINEGASPYTYNPSFFKHFKRYDTPTFFGTLNEIGVGSAAIGMLIHGLKIFGIPLIIFIGLYFVEFLQVGEYTYLILYALYCSTIVGKFVVNNLCKIIIRRNMPFFMYPNGSIFVNTTTLFGFLKMEFVVCIASLIFAHWMTSEVNLTFPQLVTQCVSKGMYGIGFLTNRILVFSKYIDDTDEEGADEEGADEEGADNIGGQIRTWCLSAADLLLPHVLPVNPLGISDLYVTKRQGILQNQATIESFKEGTKSILKVLQGDTSPMVIFYFFALSFFFAVTALSIFWETLHPVFSTAFNLLMLGAFIYAVFYKKILKGVNIAYVSAISVLMLSWSFFFIRKEGIVSWTYYLRQTHGLKVSLLEIEEAQRIADEAEQEEKAKALQALAVKQKKKQKAAAAKKKKERAKLEAQAKSKEQATDKDLSSKKNEPSGDNADENDDLFSKLPLNGSSLPGFNPDGTPSNSKGSDGSQDTDKKATSDVTSPLSFASTSLIAVGCVLIFA